MTTLLGFALLAAVIIGGLYLYFRVERLSREIAQQQSGALADGDEEEV
jgi:hypothetical protein